MVESNVKPETIQLDQVKSGQAYILVHWNIKEQQREDEKTGIQATYWRYDECVIKDWVLPKHYDTREDVIVYLKENEDEILDWAKASKVTV